MGDLLRAPLRELVLEEHTGGDLTGRDIDHRRRLPTREADRIEDEHVPLEAADRDAALLHRGDQVLIADPFEQRKLTNQRVVLVHPGW